jgi:predicted permease
MRRPLATIAAAAARGLVCLILHAHPREFRRRFGADILEAVDEDVRTAGSRDSLAAARTATTAVIDAATGLRARRGPSRPRDPHRAMGSLDLPQERTEMRTWLRDAWHDVRLGIRGFRREWAWTVSVVATLALGIGVNAAMFGVADRLLLTGPERIRDAERVRRLQIARQPPGMDIQHSGFFGYAAYDALRRNGRFFDSVAAYNVHEDAALIGRGVDARRVNEGQATASLFPLLGVTPRLGRFYTDREDDTVAPETVVVIGYGLWQSEFGGRDDVVGTPIILGDTSYTIIGVAPSGFTGPDLTRVDVWVPESLRGRQVVRPNWTQSWNSNWLAIVVRLKPGVSAEDADRETTEVMRRAYTGSNKAQANATFAVRPLTSARDGSPSMESRVSTWLAAVAAIVLLVSCANVVNLILARGIRRRREMAVRLALGAGRGRLIRLLLAEAVTLAAAGGGAGLAVAYAVGMLMRSWLMPSIEWPSGPVNVRVLALCTAVSLVAGILVGFVPAWRASAPDVSASLKAGVREGGGRRGRMRTALTMVQAALCALLLVGSGLFVVSLNRVRAMDLGLQPDRVLMFNVTRSGIASTTDDVDRQREQERRAAFYPMAIERLRQRPDVEAASLTIGLAFWNGFGEDIHVPGLEKIPQLKGGGPFLSAVTADYFKTVGTRIVRGRAFTPADRAGSAPVAIVNETMAAALWPARDAIGQCFTIEQSPNCAEIVGIAANTRHFKLEEDESLSFYVPFGQEHGIGGTELIVRPRGDVNHVLAAVRQQLFSLDPSITFVDTGILQDRVEPQVRPWELGATMFSLMGVLALVVAAVGLYSVMSYLVTHRTHEIGVRMALGARPSDVATLVMRSGLGLAMSGMVVGFALALVAATFVEPLLFRTSPRDPAVYAVVAATLVTMATLATALPAIRARRINPVAAMREE